jgi:hypothetical protein
MKDVPVVEVWSTTPSIRDGVSNQSDRIRRRITRLHFQTRDKVPVLSLRTGGGAGHVGCARPVSEVPIGGGPTSRVGCDGVRATLLTIREVGRDRQDRVLLESPWDGVRDDLSGVGYREGRRAGRR